MAGGLGFEPRQAESESAVLPLDDPPRAGCRLDYASRGFKAEGVGPGEECPHPGLWPDFPRFAGKKVKYGAPPLRQAFARHRAIILLSQKW